jgi:hypothetical protein
VDRPFRRRPEPRCRLIATVSLDRVRLWDLAHLREIAAIPLPGVLLVAFARAEVICATPDRIHALPLAHEALDRLLLVGPPRLLFEEAATDRDAFPSDRDVRYLRALLEAAGPVPLVVAERDSRPYIALSADGRWAATRVWQRRQMHVWDLEDRRCIRSFAVQNGDAVFTPDGRHFVINPLYGPCTVRETSTWSVVHEFESDTAAVAVSPDGTLLAAGAQPSGVALFRLPGFEKIASLQTEGVLTAARPHFSAAGDRLAVIQAQRVQLWDLGRIRAELDRLGLAEGLPAWQAPESAADPLPLRARVLPGELSDAPGD